MMGRGDVFLKWMADGETFFQKNAANHIRDEGQ
jgi:hypothetical protein